MSSYAANALGLLSVTVSVWVLVSCIDEVAVPSSWKEICAMKVYFELSVTIPDA